MTLKFLIAFSICLAINLGTLHSEIVQFQFSGTLPSGSSSHTFVADGESFVATFSVDNAIVDSEASDDTSGRYSFAVIGGSLLFSGGYAAPDDFDDLSVRVADNQFGFLDGIDVAAEGAAAPRFAVLFDDLTTLNSDAIPAVGTSLLSDSSSDSRAFVYFDGDGSIAFDWADSDPILFTVSSIPEPSHCLVLYSLIVVGIRRGKRVSL